MANNSQPGVVIGKNGPVVLKVGSIYQASLAREFFWGIDNYEAAERLGKGEKVDMYDHMIKVMNGDIMIYLDTYVFPLTSFHMFYPCSSSKGNMFLMDDMSRIVYHELD